GLLPAIHPSLSIWCWLIAIVCLFWDREYGQKAIREIWKPALYGLAISLLSLLVQFSSMNSVIPRVDASTQTKYVRTWVQYMDDHRLPVDLSTTAVQLTFVAILFGVAVIRYCPLTREARFMYRIFVVTAVFAILTVPI